MELREYWEQGMSFKEFVLQAAPEHRALWDAVYRTARIPAWALGAVAEPRRLLALAEDWCVDTASTLPILARWAEEVPGLELRILARDAHPELMDRYVTNGSRSIPIVLVLDPAFKELAHWGPFPAPLGAWVAVNKPPALPKDEYVKGKRSWYARDRGAPMLWEMTGLVEVRRVA